MLGDTLFFLVETNHNTPLAVSDLPYKDRLSTQQQQQQQRVNLSLAIVLAHKDTDWSLARCQMPYEGAVEHYYSVTQGKHEGLMGQI